MKKLILFFFVVIFLSAKPSFAQTATPTSALPSPTPDPLAEGAAADNASYTLTPRLEDITDTTDTVAIQFNNPDLQNGDYFVCLESDMCIDDDGIRSGISEGKQESWDKAFRGMEVDKVDEKTIQRYILKNGKIEVCGDGDSQLKGSVQDYYKGANSGSVNGGDWWDKMGKDKQGCKAGRDYFHAGKSYVIAVYQKPIDGGETWSLKEAAGIYINHAFPKVILSPTSGLTPGTQFSLNISVDKNKSAGVKDPENRNNYHVLFEASGYTARRCVTVMQGKDGNLKFPSSGTTGIPAGSVRISIKERVNELNDGPVKQAYGQTLDTGGDLEAIFHKVFDKADGPYRSSGSPANACQGGFVYYVINCKVGSDSKINKCDPPIADPNKDDIKGLLSYFDKLGGKAASTTLPCNIGGVTVSDPSKCKRLNTAIGAIPVDPIGFISRLFSVVLSIAGVGALFTIFYSGYRLLLSRGDKEMIQKARERLVAAVVGLLFIIFSMALLSIIAVDVLKIPGFG